MIATHQDLYKSLSPVQAFALWSMLNKEQLVEAPAVADPISLAKHTEHLSHAQVVLTISHRPEPFWCDVLDRLLKKPIYICARGETGVPLVDIQGNPLPVPIGHRRGEAVGTGFVPARVRNSVQVRRKTDHRIIKLLVEKNPKTPGSKAHYSFSLYKDGMSIEQFKAAGGRQGDLVYDSKAGFISLELP